MQRVPDYLVAKIYVTQRMIDSYNRLDKKITQLILAFDPVFQIIVFYLREIKMSQLYMKKLCLDQP